MVDDTSRHPFLGGEEDYKKQGLDGSHRACLLEAIDVTRRSILDILTSLPCQWICSKYRFKDDHEAMLSDVPACPSCDTTLEDTIDMCAIKWVTA